MYVVDVRGKDHSAIYLKRKKIAHVERRLRLVIFFFGQRKSNIILVLNTSLFYSAAES